MVDDNMHRDASFADLIRQAWAERDEELRRLYSRSLPLGDALFDRWTRAKSLGFEDGASIYHSAFVFGDVQVGRNTWIGPNVMLDGSGGGVAIGYNCSISAGVHIYTHDTVLWAISGGVQSFRQAPVKIGDCCYIGSQAIIAAGVTIGNNCVIGSNSFVNDDVPDRTVVAGSTARVIGKVVGEGAEARFQLFDGARI
jgi:acetyltransferase-like isoleucine patch superfamily enzyme